MLSRVYLLTPQTSGGLRDKTRQTVHLVAISATSAGPSNARLASSRTQRHLLASLAARLGPRAMRAPAFTTFRVRCVCLLLCADASAGVAQAQLLRGRWVADNSPLLMSFDFRGGDTVWQLLPIAAISENGRGTYEYAQGRVIWHYGEGLYDTATVTLRADTLVLAFDNGRTEFDARIAPALGARSPLHGTWVGPFADGELRLMTYLPGGVFFQEAALVQHYAVGAKTVTITTRDQLPVQLHIQIRGTDTVLTLPDSAGTRFRRPRCNDPRFDPRTTFTSVCS